MKKIALLTLLLINLSLSFSLPRNQASPAIFSVTKTNSSILFRHTDSTLTAIPCRSVASIVSNADPSKIVSVWVVQQGDYDKIMQFDYSVCGFSTKQEAVDSVTVWASCLYVSDSAYTTILYTNTDSATITSYDVLNSQNAPPGSPATGDTYLVGTSPTGAWVGHAKDIAEWNGSAWVFTDGVQGDFLYNATNALTYIFRSGNWVQTTGIPALNNGNTISSGLRIGTNNSRSLTFETNNVNRGRFDSVGRFYVYDTSLRKANKYLQIDSITGRLVASEISGSSASSLLFPNGREIITSSRDFQQSDEGKILIVVGNNIALTMPDASIWTEVGIPIGLKFLQGYTGCSYEAAHGFPTKVLQLSNDGEFITLITGEYLGKSSVGSIANMQVNSDGEIVTLNKYLYDKSQNAIPLSGTVSGSPVTGDIEIDENQNIGLFSGANLYFKFFGQDGYNKIGGYTVINGNSGSIVALGSVNGISGLPSGIKGDADYSANITDLDYTQKIYVDNAISSNRKVDTSYIFRNATLDSTCMITVINGITYRSCAFDSGSGGGGGDLATLIDDCQNVDAETIDGFETFPILKNDTVYQLSLGTFAELIGGGGGGISDAPSDGQLYGRQNNDWSVFPDAELPSTDHYEFFADTLCEGICREYVGIKRKGSYSSARTDFGFVSTYNSLSNFGYVSMGAANSFIVVDDNDDVQINAPGKLRLLTPNYNTSSNGSVLTLIDSMNGECEWKPQYATVPISASDTGVKGQMAVDATYLYICVDTDTWTRVALAW